MEITGLKKIELAKRAGMSRTTLDNILNATGSLVRQDTLSKLAKALGVPEPTIEPVLRLEGQPARLMTPMRLVRDARDLLGQAERLLLTPPPAASGGGDADPHSSALQGLEYLPAARSGRPKKRGNRRSGSR